MNSRQPGLFSNAQLAAQHAQQAQAVAAMRAAHANAPSNSVVRGAAPEPHRPSHSAERTASWSRGDIASDPSEIPAFLRRRDENSGVTR
jgi:hypothetical protein